MGGTLSIADLCKAAVTVSDNTAANLLLRTLEGPAGLTACLRRMGDTTTRLDRNEPTLNSAEAGDERDTTTPAAMVNTLRTLLLGDALSPASRQQWVQWLIDCETGDDRLRAGLPEKWQVGDKTGTGDHGTANDIAIAWPPGRKPILIASYLTQSTLDKDGQNAVHAGVAKLLAHTFHG